MTEQQVHDVALTAAPPMLDVQDLQISFGSRHPLQVVRSASFSVGKGEIVGLVGESGSGKSVTALGVMGLLPYLGGELTAGSVTLNGLDVTHLDQRSWSKRRGAEVGMVFQQPMRTLNPTFTVGAQIAEVVRLHEDVSRRESWDRAVDMLDRVGIDRASERAASYPHQFSGGMCQRVAIAMALVCGPQLLIADEPTTALDVSVQKRIMELLLKLREDTGISILLITHDLGLVAQVCDSVAVMYAGEVVERGDVFSMFERPQHPYTHGLIQAIPSAVNGKRLRSIRGLVPAPHAMPQGCRFHPRCDFAVKDLCDTPQAAMVTLGEGRESRCVRSHDLELRVQ